jgi:hypothetical protein
MHDSIVVVFTGGSEPGGMCNSDREPCSASRHSDTKAWNKSTVPRHLPGQIVPLMHGSLDL